MKIIILLLGLVAYAQSCLGLLLGGLGRQQAPAQQAPIIITSNHDDDDGGSSGPVYIPIPTPYGGGYGGFGGFPGFGGYPGFGGGFGGGFGPGLAGKCK